MDSGFSSNVENLTTIYVNESRHNVTTGVCSAVGECMHLFLVPVIVVCGTVGNTISLYVFACTGFRRHSSSMFLIALSITDTGFLLALFLTWVGGGIIGVDLNYSLAYCHSVVFVTYVCSCLSVWYVVFIMVGRYIVVCHPLRVQTWCSRQRCFRSCIFTAALAMLFYSQTFVTSVIRHNECTIAEQYIHFVKIFTYVDTGVTFVFPIIAVFILNVIVIMSIRRFRKRQTRLCCQDEDSTSSETKISDRKLSLAEVRVTTMLTIVSTVFLVTNLPSHAMRLYIMVYGYGVVTAQLQVISNLLYFCNFAINFLLYCATSTRFRKSIRWRYGCVSRQSSRESENRHLEYNIRRKVVAIRMK